MISYEQALDIILERCDREIGSESVALEDSLGRILATNVLATWDMPQYDHSAMDGFALRSDDIKSANEAAPVSLTVIASVFAGTTSDLNLQVGPGKAVAIATGARIPDGCDVVVRREAVEVKGRNIVLSAPARPHTDIRQKGEEFRKGQIVLEKGEKVAAVSIAIFASLGILNVLVSKRPRVVLFATGDEIVGIEEANENRLVDSNSFFLQASCRELGLDVKRWSIVRDHEDVLFEALQKATASANVVIVSGGASVGERDFVDKVLQRIGADLLFRRVACKPGKPIGFAQLGSCMVFSLPGNPGACAMAYERFVRPGLFALQGAKNLGTQAHYATLLRDMEKKKGLTHFARARVKQTANGFSADPLPIQSSGQWSPALKTQGVLELPCDRVRVERGERMKLWLASERGESIVPCQAIPPILGFVGPSGVGKTTLICALVTKLCKTMRIAVLKHTHHKFEMDREGKDTWRFSQAGAHTVGISGPYRWAMLNHSCCQEISRDELAGMVVEPTDLILCEGFKGTFGPKIEVHRKGFPSLSYSEHSMDRTFETLSSLSIDLSNKSNRPEFPSGKTLQEAIQDNFGKGKCNSGEYLAVVSDDPQIPWPVPCIDLNDVERLAEFVKNWCQSIQEKA